MIAEPIEPITTSVVFISIPGSQLIRFFAAVELYADSEYFLFFFFLARCFLFLIGSAVVVAAVASVLELVSGTWPTGGIFEVDLSNK